jgi:hypothetical protein
LQIWLSFLTEKPHLGPTQQLDVRLRSARSALSAELQVEYLTVPTRTIYHQRCQPKYQNRLKPMDSTRPRKLPCHPAPS